jgi:NAD(P)-dependent dehydrogenase (short-subunit alcohol dehydrogenase family)
LAKVRVNAIAPGVIETEGLHASGIAVATGTTG